MWEVGWRLREPGYLRAFSDAVELFTVVLREEDLSRVELELEVVVGLGEVVENVAKKIGETINCPQP